MKNLITSIGLMSGTSCDGVDASIIKSDGENEVHFIGNFFLINISFMNNFQKYLSLAPVMLTLWLSFTAGFIIEINRFFPDMLGLYF